MTSYCCWGLSSWPAGWPLPARLNPFITPSRCPHTANTYLLLSTGNFSRGLWSVHSSSLNTLTLFSRLLYISHAGLQVVATFWTVHAGILEPPVIFSYEPLTPAELLFFSPYFFHVPPPPSSLSKSVLKPVKGLMRLQFIRHWVGSAPRSFTPCLKVLSQREFLGLFMMF